MDPALELELFINVVHTLMVAISIVGIMIIGFLCLIGALREKSRRKHDEIIRKLFLLARGNFELVNDAIYFANGDLTRIVEFIVKHKDSHDGHAMRRRIQPCS